MSPIVVGLTWSQATEREVNLIASYRDAGFHLTNATNGGEGVPGHEASEELREVRRKNAAGRTHSPETKAKMAAWQIGQKRPERGAAIAEGKRMRPPPLGTFKGVSARGNSWIANIYIDGKQRYIGAFKSPEDAAVAYDQAANQAWGDKVWLNFPRSEAA